MTQAPAAIQRLCDLLNDPALGRVRVSLAGGPVLADNGQQWIEAPDALTAEQTQELRAWITDKRASNPSPLLEIEEANLRLRCLRPPLLAHGDEQVWVERARRPRVPLHQLVTQGWIRGEEAFALSRTLQQGGNILITALRPTDAQTLLDSLLEMPDGTGGDAVFLGDTRKLDARDLRVDCIDRRALAALDEEARQSLDAWLLDARWVFSDLLSCSEDVRFWSGGSLGKGRVGVLVSDGPQEALHRLHSLVFPQAQLPRTHIPGLVDLLVFVDRRQTGVPQALLWQVDMATGYLIAIEDEPMQDVEEQEQWQQEEEVSLDPAADMPSDAPAPPQNEASPDLTEAMSSAFAGFGDELFSDDEQAPPPPAKPAPAPAAQKPEASGALPEMGLSFEPDELDELSAPQPAAPAPGPSLMFGPGELDDDEPPPAASAPARGPAGGAAPSARRPPPQAAAASGTSRYNPEAIRQDAERIRSERAAAGSAPSRYRPPTDAAPSNPAARRSPQTLAPMGAPRAATQTMPPPRPPTSDAATMLPPRPSSAPPTSTLPPPAPRPAADPAAARARSGMFERTPENRSGNWRKPTGTDVRPAAPPSGSRPALARPLSSGGMRRPTATPGAAPEDLPILPSTDIEALEEEGRLPEDMGDFPHESTRFLDSSNPPPASPPGSGLLKTSSSSGDAD